MTRRDTLAIGARRLAALLVCSCLAASVTCADTPPGRRIALVIGNGDYRNVARLANPANDARLIATTLQAAHFTLIGGGAQLNVDKAQFDRLVQQFGQQIGGADAALFYYSGHGMQVQGENWLVPVDANPVSARDLDFQLVNASLVLRQMEDAGTKLNLLILDACRNNPLATRGIRATSSGLAEMPAPEGTLISYATQPGNVAADGGGADSPYTTALADALRRPGLDVFHVFNQVGLSVKQATGGAQQPWLASSPIAGNFYFFDAPGATASTVAAPTVAPAAADSSRRYDGIWDVDLSCPTEGPALGYSFTFAMQVSNGNVHGQYGVAGQGGSLLIDGTISADGVALLSANGRTGRPENNIQSYKSAPPGTPYNYSVDARFEGSHGTGHRLGGVRTCNYTFRKR